MTRVALTYDAARPEHLTVARPALEAAGLRGTFFLRPDAVLRDLAGWKALATAGHEIGSGSLLGMTDNGRLPNWTRRMVEQDLHMSGLFMQDQFGRPCRVGAHDGPEPDCAEGSYADLLAKEFEVVRGWGLAPANPVPGTVSSVDATHVDPSGLEPWLETLGEGPVAFRFGPLQTSLEMEVHARVVEWARGHALPLGEIAAACPDGR